MSEVTWGANIRPKKGFREAHLIDPNTGTLSTPKKTIINYIFFTKPKSVISTWENSNPNADYYQWPVSSNAYDIHRKFVNG